MTIAVPETAGAPIEDWAEIYDRFAMLEEDFTPLQIEAMEIEPRHSVLDLGCGSGRLTMPLARIASRVTGIDTSPRLLGRLRARAAAEGLGNITTVRADWDEIQPRRDIARHDVVIASRFNSVCDLLKLDDAANEIVYLLIFSGPTTRSLHSALLQGIVSPPSTNASARPGFATMFNEICELGLDPNVLHIPDGFSRWYENADKAAEDFGWLGVQPRHWFNLRRNIEAFLRPEAHGVRFLFPTRSTLIWWRK